MSGPAGTPPTTGIASTNLPEGPPPAAPASAPPAVTPAAPADSASVTPRSTSPSAPLPLVEAPRPPAFSYNLQSEFGRGLSVQGPDRPRLYLDVGGTFAASHGIADLGGHLAGLTGSTPVVPGEPVSGAARGHATIAVDSRYVGASVSVNASGQANTGGNADLANLQGTFSELQPQITALEQEFTSVQQQLYSAETQQALQTVNTVIPKLSAGSATPQDYAALGEAIGQIQSVNNTLAPTIASLGSRLQTMERALARVNDGSFSVQMGGSVQGMVSSRLWGRIPIGDLGRAIRDIQVLVGAGVHIPINTPESVPHQAELPQLLARASGAVRVSLAGTEQLRNTLAAARDFVSAYNGAQPYITDPTSAMNDSAGATEALGRLESSANTLEASYQAMQESLSATTDMNVDVERATGPQTTFSAGIGATFGGSDRPGAWQGVRAEFMAEDFAGFGPVTVDHYSGSANLTAGESPTMTHQGSEVRWDRTSRLIAPNLRLTAMTRLPSPNWGTGFMVEGNAQPSLGTSGVMVGVSQPMGRHFALRAGYEHVFTGGFMQPGGADANLVLGGITVGNQESGVSWTLGGGVDVTDPTRAFQANTRLQYSF